MRIIMMRHGRVDASDAEQLEEGNPGLDEKWAEEKLPGIVEKIEGISFPELHAVYCGQMRRMVETGSWLLVYGLRAKRAHVPMPIFNALQTSHDGKLYPPDIFEDLTKMVPETRAIEMLLRKNEGAQDNILVITSGARLLAARAYALGLKFDDNDGFMSWAKQSGQPEPGDLWVFESTKYHFRELQESEYDPAA